MDHLRLALARLLLRIARRLMQGLPQEPAPWEPAPGSSPTTPQIRSRIDHLHRCYLIDSPPAMSHPEYLGNAVYASLADYPAILLHLDDHRSIPIVVLEPAVISNLIEYARTHNIGDF